MKNQPVISMLHIIVVVLCAFIFIPVILSQPAPEEPAGRLYNIFFALVALGIGGFGALYPKRFNGENIKHFQRMYKWTGFGLFKLQAEKTASPYMVPFAQAMGILFFMIGLVYLYKNLLG